MSKLSDNLRILRLMSRYSQTQVGELVKKTGSTVANWENDSTYPDSKSLEKLCQLYEVTPNEILGWQSCHKIAEFRAERRETIERLEELRQKKLLLEKEMEECRAKINENLTPSDLEIIDDIGI